MKRLPRDLQKNRIEYLGVYVRAVKTPETFHWCSQFKIFLKHEHRKTITSEKYFTIDQAKLFDSFIGSPHPIFEPIFFELTEDEYMEHVIIENI